MNTQKEIDDFWAAQVTSLNNQLPARTKPPSSAARLAGSRVAPRGQAAIDGMWRGIVAELHREHGFSAEFDARPSGELTAGADRGPSFNTDPFGLDAHARGVNDLYSRIARGAA